MRIKNNEIKHLRRLSNLTFKYSNYYILHILESYEMFEGWSSSVLMLYRSVIGKISELIFLLENKQNKSVSTILRASYEAYVYFRYILEDERHFKERGEAHFLHGVLEDYKLYDKFMNPNFGKKLRDYIGITAEKLKAKELKNRKDGRGYNEKKSEIEEKYKQLIRTERVSNKWYSENNKRNNFADLCEFLDEFERYHILYFMLSQDVHGIKNDKIFSVEGIKEIDEVMSIAYMTESSNNDIEVFITYDILIKTIVLMLKFIKKDSWIYNVRVMNNTNIGLGKLRFNRI